jgi:hypothetical protein
MRRLVAVLLGIALGAIVGIMAAIPILVVLNIVGVTGFREDLPLHGVIPFIATLWGSRFSVASRERPSAGVAARQRLRARDPSGSSDDVRHR